MPLKLCVVTSKLSQDGSDLPDGKHYREAFRLLGTFYVLQPRKPIPEHFPVKERKRALGLVLRGSGHVSLDCEVGQECLDLLGTQLSGMTAAME